jgi:hypothetical protein
MGRLHFFKVPEHLVQVELKEIAAQIEAALADLGFPDDRVLCTNFDYQGTVREAN